jgi:hypothetical protein
MSVTFFYNDKAEHINKNQHDDLTLHHLVREIEKVVSNNTGTKGLPLINNDKIYTITNSH